MERRKRKLGPTQSGYVASLAGMASKGVQAGQNRMFLPIDPEFMKRQGVPTHSFSDRASRVAYQPEVSRIELKLGGRTRTKLAGLRNKSGKGTYGDAFKGRLFESRPAMKETPLEFVKQIGDDPKIRGQHSGGHVKVQSKLPRLDMLKPMAGSVEEIAGHELFHAGSSGKGAKAYTARDIEGRDFYDFKEYRSHPEEFVANKSGRSIRLGSKTSIAKHFNTPDPYVDLKDMSLGHNPKYSQGDPTEGGRRRVFSDLGKKLEPLTGPEVLPLEYYESLPEYEPNQSKMPDRASHAPTRVKSPVGSNLPAVPRSIEAIGKKVGKGAGLLGLGLQSKAMYDGMVNAKKQGAMPIIGLLQGLTPIPIERKLKDGRTYNYQTGKAYYKDMI